MNEYQIKRLNELKTKYLCKYVLWPGLVDFCKRTPSILEDLKNASNMIMWIGDSGQRICLKI